MRRYMKRNEMDGTRSGSHEAMNREHTRFIAFLVFISIKSILIEKKIKIDNVNGILFLFLSI